MRFLGAAFFLVDRFAVAFFFVDFLGAAFFFLGAAFFLVDFLAVAFFFVDFLGAAFFFLGAAFFLVDRLAVAFLVARFAVFFLTVRFAAFFLVAIMMAPLRQVPVNSFCESVPLGTLIGEAAYFNRVKHRFSAMLTLFLSIWREALIASSQVPWLTHQYRLRIPQVV